MKLDINWAFGEQGQHQLSKSLLDLLHLIREQGSLRAAVSQLTMSYRHAWGLLEKWQKVFGTPLVIMERGRGARLTELGNTLLAAEARLDASLGAELQAYAEQIRDEIEAVVESKRPAALRLHASHGLGVGLMVEMAEARGLELELQTGGSLESLKYLNSGQCEIAGFHVPVDEQLQSMLAHYRSYLKAGDYSLIHLADREQGLIVAAGNPQKITAMSDLADRALRFVNRQPGSGTRLLTDHLLASSGLRPVSIKGYEHVEFTHVAVAAMVATGTVDAGFGIRAAAAQFGLDFVPVAHENYFLALHSKDLQEPRVRDLLSLLKDKRFKKRLAALPGYDPAHAGEISSPSGLLGPGRA